MFRAENPTALLSQDSVWVMLVKAVLVFVFLVLTTLLAIWAERRVVARMQSRPGPNRLGPFGLLQSLADGIKLALKEDIIPAGADRWVFVLAPLISVTTAFTAFAVIPFGPTAHVPFTHIHTALQLTDLPVAVLFVLAVGAVGVYGIVLAGWSSGSTYPLLGGIRSSAQVISYEIAMGLALVSVFLLAGTMSTSGIVSAQAHAIPLGTHLFGHALSWPSWNAFTLPVSFGIYVFAMIGETNRAPFDLPEAEGELVGGFHTEYSSLKFALFFLAEYINMVTVSAIATTLFLGGWRAPWPLSLWHDANAGWWPLLWFVAKLWLFLFMFIWLRGTLPRLRYDQFMSLGWKVLIPVGLVWTLGVAGWEQLRSSTLSTSQRLWVLIPLCVVLVAVVFGRDLVRSRARPEAADAAAGTGEDPPEIDPFAGGFPVPPLPGQRMLRTSGRPIVEEVQGG